MEREGLCRDFAAYHMMAVTIYDYITIISLALACVTLILVVMLYVRKGSFREISQGDQDSRLEVTAIVDEFTQRLKRVEQGLIDQRVKFEILQLRMSGEVSQRRRDVTSDFRDIPRTASIPADTKRATKDVITQPVEASVSKKSSSTELEILSMVENAGKITAKEIQRRIGRTREHTARMMNILYRDGLVDRDATSRPFAYSITTKGMDMLGNKQ